MAKGKGGDGNKFVRRIKNHELINAGPKDTQEQRLQRGPADIGKKIEEIKTKQAEKQKDQ